MLLGISWAGAASGARADANASSSSRGVAVLAREPWYQAQRAPETEFRGVLQSVDADSASALQRPTLYRLDGITVFSGGRRMAALDALVGAQVVIVGKRVESALEGSLLVEIWPGFVRAAPR